MTPSFLRASAYYPAGSYGSSDTVDRIGEAYLDGYVTTLEVGSVLATGGASAAVEFNTARVLWSGPGAKNAAMAFAKADGRVTLEMTLKGRFLNLITNKYTYPYLSRTWDRASLNFVRGAEGPVHVFESSLGVRPASVWLRIEQPQLIKQGNQVIKHVATP